MSLFHRITYPTLALALGVSCDVSLGPGREITLPITNVEAPEEAVPGASFTVRVTVQSGGCRQFEQLVVTQTTERATFVARGHDTEGPGVLCPSDIRYTEREVRLDPPFTDPYEIVARQPSGPATTRTVRIR
jgi:hypothetical protein